MKVLTLDRKTFAEACRGLGEMVGASGFEPDVIVGIRTGGEYVAEGLRSMFPDAEVAYVSLQRPSTRSKTAIVRRILPLLPRLVLDALRIAEAKLLSRRGARPDAATPMMELPTELRALGRRRVLLVDDAVDSGATMLRIASALRRENPEADLRNAAITVTTLRPLIVPDFTIYNNQTLIRFPWSMDFKK